jgi:putative salt-induced outer membrane protein YdiY
MNKTTTPMRCLAVGLSALAGSVLTTTAANADENPTAWKSAATLGATVTRGNSDTVMAAGGLNTSKKWDKNELGFGAGFTYGETEDAVTAATVNGFGQYNRLFTERFYGYARLDALHDDVADISYRITLGPGAGYYLLKNDKFTLAGEAGVGWVWEQLAAQNDAGVRYWDDREYLTVRLGERFTWQISKTSKLWQSFDYSPKVDEWDDYVINAEIGIATLITKGLDLRVVAQDTYRSRPAFGSTENDFKLIAGIGYTF